MSLSKSNRIIILLVIDSLFFLLELIVGYTVHSLALVADSFHMVSNPREIGPLDRVGSDGPIQLNDVMSLCVGLWAVNVAHRKPSSKFFTYGVRLTLAHKPPPGLVTPLTPLRSGNVPRH